MDVFLLWHVHELPDGEEDAKLIGVYSTPELIEQARQRAASLPGFREALDGFQVSRYPLDRGAAGIALLASMPPRAQERDLVVQAREQEWVITHGEIEPNDCASRYFRASAGVNSPSGDRLCAGIHTTPPETAVVPPTVAAFS